LNRENAMKTLLCNIAIATFLSLALSAGPLRAQPKAAAEWTPMQMMQVKRVTGVQVSPDGKRVVYAVRQAVMDAGKSEYRTHIHLVNADGSSAIQLTKGDKSCDEPQWSPNGKWIAFLSARSGKRNVWVMPPEPGEGVRQTNVPTAVTSFQWLPGSDRISYTALDGPTPAETKAKKDKSDARVVDENVKLSRVYVVGVNPIEGNKGDSEKWTASRLTSVSGKDRAAYDWSPDGKRLAFSYTHTPSPDDWATARLSIADGPAKDPPPSLTGNTEAAETAPLWSPDGQWMAYVASYTPPTWAGSGRIHIIPAKGGKPRPLATTHDRWGRYSELIGWSADGRSLYYTEMQGTQTGVCRINLDRPVELLSPAKDAGVCTGIHLNASRTHFGFTWETRDQPPEACISPVDRFVPIVVSKVNAELPNRPPGEILGQTELIRWKSKDGLEIEGLLTYPARFEKGKRYPLLLYVHGGPMGVFTESFVASPALYPIATFSGRGYAVLRANPRGSSGYGEKFRHANVGDWGGGDYQDLMAGVDHVIKLGIADEKRLGIMGWSYGGFMTAWTVTQTQRFKAASVGAGVTDLVSFTGTSDIPGFLPDYFGGEFWDKFDAYRLHSPILHVKGVRTPTLVQHGERDERVPLSQGKEFYNALRRQGCETKMVIYPRTPHSIDEPRLLVDCMERNLEWFDRYLNNAP
jgi:dipeptidyl aminopeptidase/acylaminoacyl peptidase